MIGTLGTMTAYNERESTPAGRGLTESLSETSDPSSGGRRRVKVTRRRHPSMARISPGVLKAEESPEGAVVPESAVDDTGYTPAVEAAGSTTSGPFEALTRLPFAVKLGLGGGVLYLLYFVLRGRG